MSSSTVTRVGTAVIVTLPRELGPEVLDELASTVLRRLEREPAAALVFEATGLDLIDRHEFSRLSSVAKAASWLGVRSILVGLTPGIVRYLVDQGVDTSAFEPLGTLDDALAALSPVTRDDDGDTSNDVADDRGSDGPVEDAPWT